MNLDQVLAAIVAAHGSEPDVAFLVDAIAAGNLSARKQLADRIAMLPATLPPLVQWEVSKWGVLDSLSRCREVREA